MSVVTSIKTEIVKLNFVNKNGRIYPAELMAKAIKNCNEAILANRMFFVGPQSVISSTVNLKDVIGIVKKLTIEDNSLCGEFQFLDNMPNFRLEFIPAFVTGKMRMNLIGMGSVEKIFDDVFEVKNDFELISFSLDYVT